MHKSVLLGLFLAPLTAVGNDFFAPHDANAPARRPSPRPESPMVLVGCFYMRIADLVAQRRNPSPAPAEEMVTMDIDTEITPPHSPGKIIRAQSPRRPRSRTDFAQ